MTTVRGSCASNRGACALALTIAVVVGADVSAHRRDEYLQAARLAIDPDRVDIELDLTPGIALAEGIIGDIDRNRDGSLSAEEERAYASAVLRALAIDIDGHPLKMQPGGVTFPDTDAMRRGEGTIRLRAAAMLPRLSTGTHRLSFRNAHDPDRSVYLANALVPASDRVTVTAQSRDREQSELTIDYVLHAAPTAATIVWLLSSIGLPAILLTVLIRASRSGGLRTRRADDRRAIQH